MWHTLCSAHVVSLKGTRRWELRAREDGVEGVETVFNECQLLRVRAARWPAARPRMHFFMHDFVIRGRVRSIPYHSSIAPKHQAGARWDPTWASDSRRLIEVPSQSVPSPPSTLWNSRRCGLGSENTMWSKSAQTMHSLAGLALPACFLRSQGEMGPKVSRSAWVTGFWGTNGVLVHVVLWVAMLPVLCGSSGRMAQVVQVVPGQLHLCSAAAENAARVSEKTGDPPGITRCILAPGIYRETLTYVGYAPLEIVGAGQEVTQLRGDEPVSGLSWTRSPDPEIAVFSAELPAGVLRTPGRQQAFFEDEWLPEARYPNTNVDKVLELTSWGFCGKGSSRGYCKDRPDAWSALPHRNWTGALATLSLGTRIATWTRTVKSHGAGWFSYPASLGPGPGTRDAEKPGARYFLSGVLAALDSPGELRWIRFFSAQSL